MCGILRLRFQAVEYYEGHLLGSWGWAEFRYLKFQTAIKKPSSSEAINNADTYTRWAPLCLVWQLINANVIQNTTGKGRKGGESVLALLPELQTPVPSGCTADKGILLHNRAASGAGEAFLTPPIGGCPDWSECGS